MVSSPHIAVTQIRVYPIKSCRGTHVKVCNLDKYGLEYDRRWMIVTAAEHRFMTMRDYPQMTKIKPIINRDKNELQILINDKYIESVTLNPSVQELSSYDIIRDLTMWNQHNFDGYDLSLAYLELHQALIAHLGVECKLLFKGPSLRESGIGSPPPELRGGDICQVAFSDGYPLLLANEESFRELKERIQFLPEGSFELERFRPNIIVGQVEEHGRKETGNEIDKEGPISNRLKPYEEDNWREISIGEREGKNIFYIIARSTRCRIPNVDPNTGIVDKNEPFKTLQSYRRVDKGAKYTPCFGMNMTAGFSNGEIAVGDPVRVIKTGHHERGMRFPIES